MATMIITDSTAYLEYYKLYGEPIRVIPTPIIWNNKQYYDMIDINSRQFYHDLPNGKKTPQTYSPSIENVKSILSEIDGDRYSDVIFIPMISEISSFELVLSSIGKKFKNLNIYVFAANSTCGAMAMLVELAAELSISNVPPVIILEKLQQLRDSIKTFFSVYDLKYLYHTGRMKYFTSIFDNLLKHYPIVELDARNGGTFDVVNKHKSYQSSLIYIEDELSQYIDDNPKVPIRAVIYDTILKNIHQEWLVSFQNRFPTVSFESSIIGPAVGTHTGRKTIGISWGYDWKHIVKDTLDNKG